MNTRKRSNKSRSTRQRTPVTNRRGRTRPVAAHQQRTGELGSNCFDATEVWYEPTGEDSIHYVTQQPGEGFFHPVTASEAEARIADLPPKYTRDLEVVQLSRMTRKRALFPVYGMQWGQAVYLYPIEDSLTEHYGRAPNPQLLIDTKMYGGQWSQSRKEWTLKWTRETIRDYYLNNILIHEIGHINDTRNTSYRDRERYANWFAIEYGFKRSSRPRK